MIKVKLWLKKVYLNMLDSIAFYPTLISLCFIGVSFLVHYLERTEFIQAFSEEFNIFNLRDPATARTILGTLVGGTMSLTVFSFSMVMVVLGQTASNYSPKVLNELIKSKPPQVVLGFYVGTTIYCLLLLFKIREGFGTVAIPGLGVFIGIMVGTANIGLFVYFIHHIAQSIQVNTIINKLYVNTLKELERESEKKIKDFKSKEISIVNAENWWYTYHSPVSGYLQEIDVDHLVSVGKKHDLVIKVPYCLGSFIMKGYPLYHASKFLDDESRVKEDINSGFFFYSGESVAENYLYGFRQLTEIAVKALSPGINDPGTAITCIQVLSDLLSLIMKIPDREIFVDDAKVPRLVTKDLNFSHLIHVCFDPVRIYGKSDTKVMRALLVAVKQLAYLDKKDKLFYETIRLQLDLIIEDAERGIANHQDLRFIRDIVASMNEDEKYFETPVKLPKIKGE